MEIFMKKIVSLIMCVLLIMPYVGALAADDELLYFKMDDFSESTDISVSGSSFSSGTVTIFGFVHSGAKTAAMTAYSDTENQGIDTLIGMEQTDVESDGSFRFSFGIGDAKGGIINLKAADSDSIIYARFYYADGSELLNGLETMNSEIGALLKKCEKAEIPVEYERVGVTVFDKFSGFLRDDLVQGDSTYLSTHYDTLKSIYNEVSENIYGLLNGSVVPKRTFKYQTSKETIDGSAVIADAFDGEKIEKRPVFYTGFGHWEYALSGSEYFDDLGLNFLHAEIGPSEVLFHPDVAKEWEVISGGFVEEGTKVELTADESDGNHFITMHGVAPRFQEGYIGISQTIDVEPNKTYNFGFKIKGSVLSNGTYYKIGNAPRVCIMGEYDGFKTVTATYKTAADETKLSVAVSMEKDGGEFYLDDFYLTKKFTVVNLIRNPGFEEGKADKSGLVGGFKVKYSKIDKIKQALRAAEENNVAVTLLISPHYFPGFVSAEDGTVNDNGRIRTQYITFNPTHPKVREILELYLDILLDEVKDYKSLESIVIANEPTFLLGLAKSEKSEKESEVCNRWYLPKWQKWLAEKYKNIQTLNGVYGSDYSDFSEIMPLPWGNAMTKKTPLAMDYIEYNNTILLEFHRYMSQKIKSIDSEIKVHSKIGDYLTANRGVNYENYLMAGNDYELTSEYMDINGCDGGVSAECNDTEMQEFMMWYDIIRSEKDAPIYNTEDHIVANLLPSGKAEESQKTANWVKAILFEGAVHGRTGTTIWQWNRDDSYVNGSMNNASFALRPRDTYAAGITNLDMNRLSKELVALQNKKPRVAMLYSDYSNQWKNCYRYALQNAYRNVIESGQSVRFITEKHPEKLNSGDYDVLIAVLPNYVKSETIAELRRFISGGGKVLLTGPEPLKYDTSGRAYSGSVYSDIVSTAETAQYSRLREFIAEDKNNEIKLKIEDMIKRYVNDIHSVEITDSLTGQRPEGMEWICTDYDGDTLLYLMNLDKENAKNLFIKIDGKEISGAEELISGSTVKDSVTIGGAEPMLIKISDKAKAVYGSISLVSFNGEFSADGTNAEITQYNISAPADGSMMAAFRIPEAAHGSEVYCMIAAYGENGLISSSLTKKRSDDENGGTIRACIQSKGAKRVTAFLWDSTLRPLSKEITIQ